MTVSLHGEGFLYDLGPGLVMPTGILDRIVACAHTHKIKTVADLWKETNWSGVECYGNQIVDLILHHVPIPVVTSPFTSVPLPQSGNAAPSALLQLSNEGTPTVPTASTTAVGIVKRRIRCSACRGEGHNGTSTRIVLVYTSLTMSDTARNRDCPSHPSHKVSSTQDKENVSQTGIIF